MGQAIIGPDLFPPIWASSLRAEMREEEGQAALHLSATPLEVARFRCSSLLRRIEHGLLPSKLSDACRRTLLRLLNAEIRYLARLSPEISPPLSLNVGYLESIVRIIEQSSVTGVSRVCKPVVPEPPSSSSPQQFKPVHVDIICTLREKPVWFLVSDKNPKFITRLGHRGKEGLRSKLERILSVARSSVSLKPDSVVLFFSKGLRDDVSEKLIHDLRATELELEFESGTRIFEVNVEINSCVSSGCTTKIPARDFDEIDDTSNSSREFKYLLSSLRRYAADGSIEQSINLDTTALIAIISGISNEGIDRMLEKSEIELRTQFKGNYEFVLAQAMSERQDPIIPEINSVINGKKGIICESVLSEFKGLVSMYGGTNERARADQLLKSLQAVADNPSQRVSALPTTRKIALKNKIIFGTGDRWRALTLSANEGFMRAISQTGMSLLSVKHRPRALIGD